MEIPSFSQWWQGACKVSHCVRRQRMLRITSFCPCTLIYNDQGSLPEQLSLLTLFWVVLVSRQNNPSRGQRGKRYPLEDTDVLLWLSRRKFLPCLHAHCNTGEIKCTPVSHLPQGSCTLLGCSEPAKPSGSEKQTCVWCERAPNNLTLTGSAISFPEPGCCLD